MTKRELRKELYRRIVKEATPHQIVFDDLISRKSGHSDEEIAIEAAKHPTPATIAKNHTLKIVFIVLMSLIILLRGAGLFLMSDSLQLNPALLLIVILIGIVTPAAGIVLAIQNRADGYRLIAILFVVSIVRSLKELDFGSAESMIGFIPFVLAVALGFWMSVRLKTPYKKHIDHSMDGDRKVVKVRYAFEESAVSERSDLLDGGI